MSGHPVQVEILLSKLQAGRTQTREPNLIFNFLLSFGCVVLHVWPVQMVLLCALLFLLFLLFFFGFEKYILRDKQEGIFFSSLGTTDTGHLSTWKVFLLVAAGLLGESSWEFRGWSCADLLDWRQEEWMSETGQVSSLYGGEMLAQPMVRASGIWAVSLPFNTLSKVCHSFPSKKQLSW